MKIVLAVDGSAYTKRMLSYIAAHDELVGRDTMASATAGDAGPGGVRRSKATRRLQSLRD
jgi:hypothetical protein